MFDKAKEEIKNDWDQYRGQIICTFLLTVVCFILGFLQQWGVGYAVLVGILIYDVILDRMGRDTVTKWARRQLPSVLDKIVMAILFCLVVKYATFGDGWGAGYWFLLGTINGHINWEN